MTTIEDATKGTDSLILLGLLLLILGFVLDISILWTAGILLVLLGVAFLVLGSMGRAVGGRRHYY